MEQREWKDNIYQKGGKFDPDNITISKSNSNYLSLHMVSIYEMEYGV